MAPPGGGLGAVHLVVELGELGDGARVVHLDIIERLGVLVVQLLQERKEEDRLFERVLARVVGYNERTRELGMRKYESRMRTRTGDFSSYAKGFNRPVFWSFLQNLVFHAKQFCQIWQI